MITNHQYLDKYPISKNSERLIVGTIHPHDHEKFAIPFFYGNVKSIWTILSEAFPNDLHKPLTLNSILDFLEHNKISMSDTIRKCERTNIKADDDNIRVIELNNQIVEEIKNSKITEILFTSGFAENNAFKLFYVDILQNKITSDIRKNREIMLDKEIFGRQIKLTILYSPSGNANRGIAKSKIYLANKQKYENFKNKIQAFKVDYYREKFGNQ